MGRSIERCKAGAQGGSRCSSVDMCAFLLHRRQCCRGCRVQHMIMSTLAQLHFKVWNQHRRHQCDQQHATSRQHNVHEKQQLQIKALPLTTRTVGMFENARCNASRKGASCASPMSLSSQNSFVDTTTAVAHSLMMVISCSHLLVMGKPS